MYRKPKLQNRLTSWPYKGDEQLDLARKRRRGTGRDYKGSKEAYAQWWGFRVGKDPSDEQRSKKIQETSG